MCIQIRAVAYVVAPGFHPKRYRVFPAEPFSGPGCQRRIENLAVFSIRSIETGINSGTPVPDSFFIIVERILTGPTIVGVPGGIRTLEEKVDLPIVFYDKSNITLQTTVQGGQFAEIDSTCPVLGNRQSFTDIPLAFPEPSTTCLLYTSPSPRD